MADNAIALSTARGEVKIATDLIVDPTFGPVHLFRVVGGAGGGGDASAANQTTEIARLEAIRDRLPTVLVGDRLKVDIPAGGSGLTDTELRAAPVPVSGAFFPGVQPVSGAFWQAVQPVSGTFWQATQPVSGTFWQATQPVSGPLTDTQLRTTPVPVSGTVTSNAGTNLNTSALNLEATQVAMSGKLPATLGQKAMAASMSVVLASDQPTVPVSMAAAAAIFKGRACTFRTPGRAGTAGQKILAIYHATGSGRVVKVLRVFVDLYQTVVKAITVPPPNIRLWKFTAAHSNGSALTKNKVGGSGASHANVTVSGDASADGTGSTTTLTVTLPAGTFVSQEFAPRFVTAAGYEMADRIQWLEDSEIELAANEGLCLFLDYLVATMNPVTDMWIAGVEWSEN